MKIAVFGIGGVGGFTGAMLARSYSETYFIARGENLRAIRENGVTVESASLGNFTARPKEATDHAADIGIADAVLIASKGHNLSEVCKSAAPMIGPHTAVIPLLNGVAVSEQMEPYLPTCILADGLIRIFCHLKAPGYVYHQSGGSIVFGMRDGSKPPVLQETADLLSRAGIPASVSDHILTDNWKKYTSMCGNSTVFGWFDAPAGGVRQNPGYEDVVRAIIGELVSVAAARGVVLPPDTIDSHLDAFAKLPPETMTSLYRDLSGGKPAEQTELSHLIGRMVQLGKETGTPTPYHQAVFERYQR